MVRATAKGTARISKVTTRTAKTADAAVTHDDLIPLKGAVPDNASQVRVFLGGVPRLDIASRGVTPRRAWELKVPGHLLGKPGRKKLVIDVLDDTGRTIERSALEVRLESYGDLVPIPGGINHGLRAAKHATMMNTFGAPCTLSDDCSGLTNAKLKANTVTRNVGPFRVTGLIPAVEALARIFRVLRTEKPALYAAVGSKGMSCCRRVRRPAGRRPSTNFSNHSWGTAIDLTIHGVLDSRSDGKCQRGLLELAPYFHREGFYWGAGFSGTAEDAMHFEAAEETVTKWAKDL